MTDSCRSPSFCLYWHVGNALSGNALSGSALSSSAPRPSQAWSVHGSVPVMVGPGRSWSVPGHSPVGHGRFMMSVPDVSPQFQSWVRHLRHTWMPLRYLWTGEPCRRGPRALFIDRLGIGSVPVCHAGMALEHLWAGEPCRRPVRSPPSPRGDATEIPVDRGAVPKTGQKNSLARDNLYLMGAALFPCAREHTPL